MLAPYRANQLAIRQYRIRMISYLRQGPDSVVFGTLSKPIKLENSNPSRLAGLDAPSTWGLIIPVEEALFREPGC